MCNESKRTNICHKSQGKRESLKEKKKKKTKASLTMSNVHLELSRGK